jgi:glycolate dehydrogenase FAD-binding subunit
MTTIRDEAVDILRVRDARDVEEAVRAAIATEQPLEIIGEGSKRLIGQPMSTNAVLDLSAIGAVKSYEPNELIITVDAGAPLAEVKSLIDSKNQQFAFEPVDTAPLLGVAPGGTIGGMIAAGLAGPRRIKAGGRAHGSVTRARRYNGQQGDDGSTRLAIRCVRCSAYSAVRISRFLACP